MVVVVAEFWVSLMVDMIFNIWLFVMLVDHDGNIMDVDVVAILMNVVMLIGVMVEIMMIIMVVGIMMNWLMYDVMMDILMDWLMMDWLMVY